MPATASTELQCTPKNAIITGWDFSTGSVKCLAFDLDGNVVAEFRGATDLWERDGAVELNAMMLEGQTRASVRGIASQLRQIDRLKDWIAGGISATHHTAGRIDSAHNPLRRLICWNDQTLADYYAMGMKRLGGEAKVQELIGGPWAVRYSLSHLVKDEKTLSANDWKNTKWMLPHGPLAAGYLTGRFDCTSVSSAASTGIMDFRTNRWQPGMLKAIESSEFQQLAEKNLPKIIDMNEPIGSLAQHICVENNLTSPPLVFPTLDDQAAGLIGGGATESGQVAIILGNSAVVNSSASTAPVSTNTQTSYLDAMKLNWGPYLWMRCYSNGAQFVDRVVGANPDWPTLEAAARSVPAGCNGVEVLPFVLSEPSLGVHKSRVEWKGQEPSQPGVRLRAAYEAVAFLIALGVKAHEQNGQKITRISVSGGIARSQLMCEILSSALNRPLERLVSYEGTALGAAVAALAGYETFKRTEKKISQPYTAADAVSQMVKFKDTVAPNADWAKVYDQQLGRFANWIKS